MATMKKFKDVEEYISDHPKEIQELLKQMRAVIKKAAPKAEEVISYGMPGYKLNGMLVWFGAFKKHIGFFPKTSVMKVFEKELENYEGGKGTIQFPYSKALPKGLITKIVKYRVKENLESDKAKNY